MFYNRIDVRFANIFLFLLLMVSLYFIFSKYGIMRQVNDSQQHLSTKTQKSQMLQTQNAQKKHDNSLLNDEQNIDPDMLEELNRRLFNTHKEDEIQVPLD